MKSLVTLQAVGARFIAPCPRPRTHGSWLIVHRSRPSRPRARGTMTGELALILPMILILVMGTLELGRVYQAWVVVSNAAREGARAAALGVGTTTVQSTVLDDLQTSGMAANMGVQLPSASDVLVQPSTGTPGDMVTVYVPLWVKLQVPLISALMPANPLKVGAYSTMRRQ